jgi:hypothetical protein
LVQNIEEQYESNEFKGMTMQTGELIPQIVHILNDDHSSPSSISDAFIENE